jgi:hypothetical protein
MNKLSQGFALCLCVAAGAGLFGTGRAKSPAPAESVEEQLIRTNPLGPMWGKQVLVVGRGMQQTFEEHGRIEAQDGQWLRIRTKDGRVLSYSIANLLWLQLDQEAKP